MAARRLASSTAPVTPEAAQLVTEVERLDAADELDDALDVLYRTVDEMMRRGHFADVDDMLARVDVTALSPTMMIGWLSITLVAGCLLANRSAFVARVRKRLTEIDPVGVERLLAGLE